MKIVSATEMRELDKRTIESGISGNILMERAGAGAVEHILDYTFALPQEHVKRFVLLAGKGNNGGDAYVCARLLEEQTDLEVVIYSVCHKSELKGEAAVSAEQLSDSVPVIFKEELDVTDFKRGDIIIDGLLGTGISGPLKAPYEQWINCVNNSNRPVISLDIPSGLNGTSGMFTTAAIIADLTITIGLPKHGLYLESGPEYCGQLRLVDIGIPEEFLNAIPEGFTMPFADSMAPKLGRIPAVSHKNSRGKLLVIGGSSQYAGAPFLAARSAMRSGAGYVKLAVPQTIAGIYKTPSLVTVSMPEGDAGSFGRESISELEEIINNSDAVVIGPGLGNARSLVPFMEYICSRPLPIVFDADALNQIALLPDIYQGKDSNILTPHPGEMKRLLEGFDLEEQAFNSRTEQAQALAEATDSTIVLKGHRTVICSPDGRLSINSTGGPALSVAGTGDCLSGVIGAFAAQGMDPFEAAEIGVFLHGLAGEMSPYGMRGMIPEDLIELIPQAMQAISPFA